MNNSLKSRQLVPLVVLSATLMLVSCAKKEEQATTTAPSAAPSAPAAPASPAPASPAASASPSAMSGANGKPVLSAEAQKLGVKPENATTCPGDAPVKGNVTKKRGELYFTTKFPDYKSVKPEICFKDVETAEKAGFRAPKAQ
ncbi:hypothetical protein K9N68_27190 [Kovacikia minuta CCNUW1]|uniref:sunset domain-containing protein n=1 Tax=Kovacikia minuta TaxID=2931930 RepID=UPI001CCE88EC|nr:hypothetical protein [Kovacikia minuta]UBF25264.1 hypothetical protein K9N68_27190 [Kovacikia minuta CCNUW1]